MKVIFLDFDGVLVVPPDLRAVEPSRKALLGTLASKSGARVVVSSTWRMGKTKDELSDLLGLPVFDVTPRSTSGVRGEEIAEWLSTHRRVKSFVVLDDDGDRGPIPEDRWVLTTFWRGLQPEHVKIALDVLAGRA